MEDEIWKHLPAARRNIPVEPLLGENILAISLDVSRRTLQKWRADGTGPPYIKLAGGRLVRYRISDVKEWLSSHVVTNTCEKVR